MSKLNTTEEEEGGGGKLRTSRGCFPRIFKRRTTKNKGENEEDNNVYYYLLSPDNDIISGCKSHVENIAALYQILFHIGYWKSEYHEFDLVEVFKIIETEHEEHKMSNLDSVFYEIIAWLTLRKSTTVKDQKDIEIFFHNKSIFKRFVRNKKFLPQTLLFIGSNKKQLSVSFRTIVQTSEDIWSAGGVGWKRPVTIKEETEEEMVAI